MRRSCRDEEAMERRERILNKREKKKHSAPRLKVVLRKLTDIKDCCLSTHSKRCQPDRSCKHTVHNGSSERYRRNCSGHCEELLKSWKAPTRVHRLPKHLKDYVLDKTVLHLIQFSEWYYSGRVAHHRACKNSADVTTHHANKRKQNRAINFPVHSHTPSQTARGRPKKSKVKDEKRDKRNAGSKKYSHSGRPRKQKTTYTRREKKKGDEGLQKRRLNSVEPKKKKSNVHVSTFRRKHCKRDKKKGKDNESEKSRKRTKCTEKKKRNFHQRDKGSGTNEGSCSSGSVHSCSIGSTSQKSDRKHDEVPQEIYLKQNCSKRSRKGKQKFPVRQTHVHQDDLAKEQSLKKLKKVRRCKKNKVIHGGNECMIQSKKKRQHQTCPSLEQISCDLSEICTTAKRFPHEQGQRALDQSNFSTINRLVRNSANQTKHKKTRSECTSKTDLNDGTRAGVASVLMTQSKSCFGAPDISELRDENNNVIEYRATDTVQTSNHPSLSKASTLAARSRTLDCSSQRGQGQGRRRSSSSRLEEKKLKKRHSPVLGRRRSRRLMERENFKRHYELWTAGNSDVSRTAPSRRSLSESVAADRDDGIDSRKPSSEKASFDDLLQELASICPLTGDLPFSAEDCVSLLTESPVLDGSAEFPVDIAQSVLHGDVRRKDAQMECPKTPPVVRRSYLEYLMDEFSIHLLANQPERTPPWRSQGLHRASRKRVSMATRKDAEIVSAFGPLSHGALKQLQELGLAMRNCVGEEFGIVAENTDVDQMPRESQMSGTVPILEVENVHSNIPILVLPRASKNLWDVLHVLEIWLPSSVLYQDTQHVYFRPMGHWAADQSMWQVQMALWKNQDSGGWSLTQLKDPWFATSTEVCFVPEEAWLRSQGVAQVNDRRVYAIYPSPVAPSPYTIQQPSSVQRQNIGPHLSQTQVESLRSQSMNPSDSQKRKRLRKFRTVEGPERRQLQQYVQPPILPAPLITPISASVPAPVPSPVSALISGLAPSHPAQPSPASDQGGLLPTPVLQQTSVQCGPSLMLALQQKSVSVQANSSAVMFIHRDCSFPGVPSPFLYPVTRDSTLAHILTRDNSTADPNWQSLQISSKDDFCQSNHQTVLCNKVQASSIESSFNCQGDTQTAKSVLSLPADRIGAEPKECFTVPIFLNASDTYHRQFTLNQEGKTRSPTEHVSRDGTSVTLLSQGRGEACQLATPGTTSLEPDGELLLDINNNHILQECVEMMDTGSFECDLTVPPPELPSSVSEAVAKVKACETLDGLARLVFDWCVSDLPFRSHYQVLAQIDQLLGKEPVKEPAQRFCTFAASVRSVAEKANYDLSKEDESMLVQLGLAALHRCQVQEPVGQSSTRSQILEEHSKTQSSASDKSLQRQEAYCILHMLNKLHLPLIEFLVSSSKLLPWLQGSDEEPEGLLVMGVVTTLTEFDPAMAFSVIQGIGWSHCLWETPKIQEAFPGHLAALAEALLDCNQYWPCRTVLSHLALCDDYSGPCRHLYNGLLSKLLGASQDSNQAEAAMAVFEDMMDSYLVVSTPSISRLLSLMWERREGDESALQDALCVFHYGLGLGAYPMYRKTGEYQWETTLFLGATKPEVFFTLKTVLDEIQHWCTQQFKVISKNVQKRQQQSTPTVVDNNEHHGPMTRMELPKNDISSQPMWGGSIGRSTPVSGDDGNQIQAQFDKEIRTTSLKIRVKKHGDVCEDFLMTEDQTAIEVFSGMLSTRSVLVGVLQEFFQPLSVSLCADPPEGHVEQHTYTFTFDPDSLRSWLISALRK